MMFRCAFFLLFLTIGLATTTDGPTTPAPMTTAITETTAAPVVTTAAPVVTTEAPVVTTEAPVVTTAAPVVTTAAPVVTTAAPVVTTAAPVVTTAAPVVTTAAPVVTTAAPVVTTVEPVVTTVEPVVTTVEPVVTTVEPDVNVTTTAPATNATTEAPATNATTAEPVTNATTAAPVSPTTPTPSLPTPTTGQYNVTSPNGTCLMAKFGLRISLKEGETSQDVNLDPSGTAASGVCGPDSSDLVLTSDKITIMLTFTTEAKKFQLHSLNVTVKSSSGAVFVEANTNLSLWQAALGSSYMCNKQQNFNITNSLTLHTFDLRVQPFEVQKAEFSTAHECSLDDTSILIPIIVGAALAGLILIVVIAYAIGRRKTYVGYQTL